MRRRPENWFLNRLWKLWSIRIQNTHVIIKVYLLTFRLYSSCIMPNKKNTNYHMVLLQLKFFCSNCFSVHIWLKVHIENARSHLQIHTCPSLYIIRRNTKKVSRKLFNICNVMKMTWKVLDLNITILNLWKHAFCW